MKILVTIVLLLGFVCGNATNGQVLSAASDESRAPQSTPTDALWNGQEVVLENNGEETVVRISVKSEDHEIVYALNNSRAARGLYEQLPLVTEAEPFSNNEITFYPPKKLHTADAPLSSGAAGTLSYYAPWGDVVLFYDDCDPNGSLYELGTVVSGADDIAKLTGKITITGCE